MKLRNKLYIMTALLASFIIPLSSNVIAAAAASPALGAANTFVILSDTYSNTASGTTLNGDVGFTTPPAVVPTINGTTHQADGVYSQAGIDQNSALVALNNQPCTFSFAPGPIDLASDTTHGAVGVYAPGVYCISGAASVGGGGTITLNGGGTYIFRMDGALTTSPNSVVALSGGASNCNVWWTPTQASTMGANSNFSGTTVDAPGITIGNSVTWTGRALSFGGTVSTDADTMSAPTCSVAPGLPNTAGEIGTNYLQAITIAVLFGLALATALVVRKSI